MDLRDYLRVLRKSWTLILAFVAVGLAAGVGLTVATTKLYQADVQLFVAPGLSQDNSQAQQGNALVQNLVGSLTSAANTESVVQPVYRQFRDQLPKGTTEQDLEKQVSADAPLNKTLLNLHVTDTDPALASQLANALADRYVKVITELTSPTTSGVQLVKASVLSPARVPGSPVRPNKTLNLGLGLVVGLLIGVGVAVLREVLDTTVKGPKDFEEVGVPVLTLVPFDKRTVRMPVAFRDDAYGARSEAYRQLRTNLQFVDVDNPPRIIAITSAVPGEGKTTSAINLAAALAEAGSRVCLVEADLRRPSIAKSLGLIGDVGFTTAVIGQAPVRSVLQNAGQNLAVLTSGPIPPNPSELLLSKHARRVIAELAEAVDFVIIDTPPLLPVTDGAQIATIADATLLVHRAGRTTRDQALRSVQALEKVGRRPVGVVLNMISRSAGRYSYEYGYYHSDYRPDGERRRGGRRRSATADSVLDPQSSALDAAGAPPSGRHIDPADPDAGLEVVAPSMINAGDVR